MPIMSIFNNTVSSTKRALVLALAAVGVASAAAAQVGHPPSSSPYRELRASHVLAVAGGYIAGSSGAAGVAPSDGPFGGLRFDIYLGRSPIAMTFSATRAELQRVMLDPTFGPTNRLIDSVTQAVVQVDAGFTFTLTGRKTWNRVAPYVGATLGIALGGNVPSDTVPGQYRFETHFTVSPELGFAVHFTDRISLRVAGRDVLWRITHPNGFFTEPFNAPGEPPILTDSDQRHQWLHHPTLTVALGYALRL